MEWRSFLRELKRRNVFRAAIGYAAIAWMVIQICTQTLPFFETPAWVLRFIIIVLPCGFPFAMVWAWMFELTPQGIIRTEEVPEGQSITRQTGRKLDFIIISVLALAIALLVFDRSYQPKSRENAAISENSIAVLPFVDMSEAKDQGYFSDGISEELLNLLSKIPQLKVAARTSSFSFKGKEVEIPEIARQLRVAHVLEGSVRRSRDRLRITAQLIRATEGYHIWSETYDRKMDDIFKIQDEIAGDVVKELKVKLLGAAPKVRTTDPQAYALYLQARDLGRQHTPETYAKSDALYRQILEIDPRYAPAWNGLAANFVNKTGMGLMSSQEGYAHAREAAEKAVSIDPDYAPAYANLGYIAMDADNDLAAAARHYQRALALDPSDITVLSNAATFLSSLGRLDEGLALQEAVVRRDPVNAMRMPTSAHPSAALAATMRPSPHFARS